MTAATKGRLTTPLVRDGDGLRPATWDEALDTSRRRALARARSHGRDDVVRDLLVLEGDERDELPRSEVRAPGDGHEQHRQLQPHLTRA